MWPKPGAGNLCNRRIVQANMCQASAVLHVMQQCCLAINNAIKQLCDLYVPAACPAVLPAQCPLLCLHHHNQASSFPAMFRQFLHLRLHLQGNFVLHVYQEVDWNEWGSFASLHSSVTNEWHCSWADASGTSLLCLPATAITGNHSLLGTCRAP
jgi:hypothetical protein